MTDLTTAVAIFHFSDRYVAAACDSVAGGSARPASPQYPLHQSGACKSARNAQKTVMFAGVATANFKSTNPSCTGSGADAIEGVLPKA